MNLMSKKHGGAGRGQGRKPLPFPKVQKHTVKLRAPMWDALESEAVKRGITVNKLVETFVGQGLGLPGYG